MSDRDPASRAWRLLRVAASTSNGLLEVLGQRLGRLGWHRAQRVTNTLAHRCVLAFLRVGYRALIDEYRSVVPSNQPAAAQRVAWVMWWQGEAEAPELIRMCIAGLRRNLPDVRIVLIDSKNYHEYAHVSSTVLERLGAGRMSLTQFSDIVRTAILRQHGGLWIDAAMLTIERVPESVFDAPFYTRKTDPNGHNRIVSDRRWMVGLIGGSVHHVAFGFVNDMFEAYWRCYETSLHPYMMDYFLALAYMYDIGGFRKTIDNLENNNPDAYEMRQLLGSPFDPDHYNRLREGDTHFFTLDRRFIPPTGSGAGQTYYEFLRDALL